jgi:hypothetical protein
VESVATTFYAKPHQQIPPIPGIQLKLGLKKLRKIGTETMLIAGQMIRLPVLILTFAVVVARDAIRLQRKLRGSTLARLGTIGSVPMTIRLPLQTRVVAALLKMALLRHRHPANLG